MDLIIVRVIFVAILGCAGYYLQPFKLDPPVSAAAGVVLGCAIVLFEVRIKEVSLKRLIGAAFGSVLGILGAYLISLVLSQAIPDQRDTLPFIQIALLAFM